MKIALITTTINVPKVLSLYRRYREDVCFFVAGDHKTPLEAVEFCAALPNTRYIPTSEQLKWKCSPLLGFDNDSRRNIALLEALEWGADLLVSVDDDMLPTGLGFFEELEWCFMGPFSGLQLGEPGYWLDVGHFTVPPAIQRGIPPHYNWSRAVYFATDAKIGVAQGIILGVPDTDASTHITSNPIVTGVHEVLRAGFVAHPECYTVFNSQITAFRRELAPAFAQFYRAEGRNTDILASVIMRRIMRDLGLYTYFGPPMAYHARNAHVHFQDLQQEILGLKLIAPLVEWLDRPLAGSTAFEMTRNIYSTASAHQALPSAACDAALAWLQDVEIVL